MTKEIKRRRGTTVEHNTFTGAEGEITIDSDINIAVIHDGAMVGGYPLAKADMSNADLSNKINVNELATSDGASGDILTTDGSGQIVFALPGGITGNSVGVVELDTSDGLAGTVLTTNGAGTISFKNVFTETTVTPTVGQTVFPLVYVVGRMSVYLNGVKLVNSTDFTATNGTDVTLIGGLPLATVDRVEFHVFC